MTGTAFSPGCFLCDSQTPLCKTTLKYFAATMFLFYIVPSLAFQTAITLSRKARNRSDDVKVVFVVIQINLFFSLRSLIDNIIEMFSR